MKVKELLEDLKDADPEAEIHFRQRDGCCSDWFDLDMSIDDIDIVPAEFCRMEHGYVDIYLPAVWFFDSCITGGRAKEAALKHKKNVYGKDWKPGMPNDSIRKEEDNASKST